MFLKGINYDVGSYFRKGKLSRPDFIEADIRKEIEIIRHDLHCNAIRISGFDIARLIKASEFALEEGLQVWLSPACIDLTREEALRHLTECAREAEQLRLKYPGLILVVGCEYSLFLKGFLKGETIYDRLKRMFNPFGIFLNIAGLRQGMYRKLNLFLGEMVQKIRHEYSGQLAYASGTWENINWDIFDYVGIDHYRASYNKANYSKQIAAYYKFNKPVCLLEFGCCAYKGAEDKGGAAWAITEFRDGKLMIKGKPVRDEDIQSDYILDLLNIFKSEKVFAAFVFTFINPRYKFNPDPLYDLDMASYGIVKPLDNANPDSYKGLPWIPKKAFYSLAEFYKGMGES
jgi:hypothetical protein